MAVDKNLFLYDLAVVAIMKNEGPYIKEWLDYHINAGVDHFYIYDNDSPDNQREVLKPYIESGIVTYIYYPGKARQYEAYNEAVKKYRFICRYIAFIDGDEFIFPQSNRSITEVIDKVLADKPNAGALAVNELGFGSNFQETADYSRGILERFTRRSDINYAPPLPVSGIPGGNAHVKTIANPRKIDYFFNPHFAIYFEGYHAINEDGGIVENFSNNPPTVNKIRIHHYNTKSHEEWAKKVGRGTADAYHNVYKLDNFSHDKPENEVFDDSILGYQKSRHDAINGGGRQQPNYSRVFNAAVQNLSLHFSEDIPNDFLSMKLETFLTCRGIAAYLWKAIDKSAGASLEETALKAVHKALGAGNSLSSIRLLLSELPSILALNYPVVQDIRKSCIDILPQVMDKFRAQNPTVRKDFLNLKYLMDMLKTYDAYDRK